MLAPDFGIKGFGFLKPNPKLLDTLGPMVAEIWTDKSGGLALGPTAVLASSESQIA